MCAFEVGPEHMDAMGQGEAVCLLRDLIYADARASGIPYDRIDVPQASGSPNGGIDGVVRGAPEGGRHGIVKKGLTCYRVKPGKIGRRGLNEILFDGEKIKSRIKSCLDKNGTLVVALTGQDEPGGARDEIAGHLEGFDPRYAGASVEVWDRGAIAGFLRHFPSLRLEVLGVENAGFLLHEDWSQQAEMRRKFHRGKEQEDQIARIRAELRGPGPAHIRIGGAPGSGKTRLVLEATDTDDLRPLVVYADGPSALAGRGFFAGLCGGESGAILVVDGCDFACQADLHDRLGRKKGVRLVTICNGEGPAGRLEVGGLDRAGTEQVLRHYVGDAPDLGEWAEFCGRSARAAHTVGQNLRDNPQDVLAPPDTVDVWGRYIADKRAWGGGPQFEDRLGAMTWLSLFSRLGNGGELARIRGLLAAKGAVPEGLFGPLLARMRDRKIVQGRAELYIAPRALHVYLWIKWWKEHETDMFPAKELERAGLLDRCMDMFGYARRVPEARKIAERLGREGWPESVSMGSHPARRFFGR